MRIIKFRAYDKETKKIYPVYTIHWAGPDIAYIQIYDKKYHDSPECFRDIAEFDLMQYTGLKDKNGVEIYEGDILKDYDEIEVVKYYDGYFAPLAVYAGHGYIEKGEPWRYPEDAEVIGNKFENPELLTDK